MNSEDILVWRSDEEISFDLKNLCNATFIGSSLCILEENFITQS